MWAWLIPLCIQAKVDTVPQFYFPGGKPVPAEVRASALEKIDELFRSNPDGLAVPAVRELVKEVGYPSAVLKCSTFLSHYACTAACKLCAPCLVANTLGCSIMLCVSCLGTHLLHQILLSILSCCRLFAYTAL